LEEWYEDFPEVPDEDVIALLSHAADSRVLGGATEQS